MPPTSDDYLHKALEADLRALKATDPDARATFLELAAGWRQLAQFTERARKGQTDIPPEQIGESIT